MNQKFDNLVDQTGKDFQAPVFMSRLRGKIVSVPQKKVERRWFGAGKNRFAGMQNNYIISLSASVGVLVVVATVVFGWSPLVSRLGFKNSGSSYVSAQELLSRSLEMFAESSETDLDTTINEMVNTTAERFGKILYLNEKKQAVARTKQRYLELIHEAQQSKDLKIVSDYNTYISEFSKAPAVLIEKPSDIFFSTSSSKMYRVELLDVDQIFMKGVDNADDYIEKIRGEDWRYEDCDEKELPKNNVEIPVQEYAALLGKYCKKTLYLNMRERGFNASEVLRYTDQRGRVTFLFFSSIEVPWLVEKIVN
jgi:hypothetical protein